MKKIIRAVFIITGCVLLFVFIAPLKAHILNIGNIAGMVFSLLMILTGIFLNQLISLAGRIKKTKVGKFAYIAFLTAVTAVLLCFFTALGSAVAASSTNADGQQVVIVLGCKVNNDKPSLMLYQRINSAYEYLLENPRAVAVLSGGQGYGEDISEAYCMYLTLTEKGIDPERLYMEGDSTNTFENIKYSKQIIDENNLSTDVAIATSDFHLKRAVMIAEKQGLNAKRICAKSPDFSKPTYYVRDTLGVIKEFIFR